MEWIITNWDSILFAITTIVTAASAITALTPTPADDAFVGKIYKVVEKVARGTGRAKEKSGDSDKPTEGAPVA